MSAVHGKGTKVLVNQYDLSSFLNEATTTKSADTAETTTFGAGSVTRIAGLGDGKIALKGLFDGSATGLDALVQPMVNGTDEVVTVAQGGYAIGASATIGQGLLENYETSSPVKDVVSASLDITSDGGLEVGRVLAGGRATANALTDNATGVDNAAASANGGIAVAHLTGYALVGGNVTVKVQHSTDNVTFVDLVTVLSAVTAVGSAIATVAAGTNVNRYLRAQITTTGSSGSVTTTLSFARR